MTAWRHAGRAPAARVVLLLALLAAVPGPTPLPNDLVARGAHGAVATAESHATEVGIAVLRDGGNAVDAAVAIALTLAVTHPQAGNLGGGGFLLIRMADGRATAIDFREKAPAGATADMYLRPDGTVDTDKVQYGCLAAGVPGSPAGLALALQKYGTRSLPQLAGPAIRLAREGFPVDQFLAADLREEREHLLRHPSTKAIFCRGDEPLRQGDLLVQQDLAATLERFAAEGPAGFYGGVTAERIVEQMRADGGRITAADLAAYAPVEREVVRGTYRGHEIVGMPPPSSGGIAVQQMLNVLEPFDLRALGFGGSRYLHLVSEVMRLAFADRSRWLGDPDFTEVPVAGLLSRDYAAQLREGLRTDRKNEVRPGLPPGGKESDDTTHFSVVDAAGNVVACTTTINSTFGSMCVVAGAGFLLNNEMDDFSARPGVPNQFGLIGGKANAIAPHKRMLSSMTPTIVLRDGKVRFVLGAPGGARIITAVLQVLLNTIDHGMSLEQAVRAPRVHHQWLPDELRYEALALSPDVRQALAAMGHTFAARPVQGIGQVFALEIAANGERIAVCDHRSGGSAAAY
jgi:gamma-glutamyltranspeptidase/glutathione hydrolase